MEAAKCEKVSVSFPGDILEPAKLLVKQERKTFSSLMTELLQVHLREKGILPVNSEGSLLELIREAQAAGVDVEKILQHSMREKEARA